MPRVQVVLLAAGPGGRLGALTAGIPKALVEVGGEPLVVHALRFAARLAPSRTVVVGGVGFPQLAAALARRTGITPVENQRFRGGNPPSAVGGRPHPDR